MEIVRERIVVQADYWRLEVVVLKIPKKNSSHRRRLYHPVHNFTILSFQATRPGMTQSVVLFTSVNIPSTCSAFHDLVQLSRGTMDYKPRHGPRPGDVVKTQYYLAATITQQLEHKRRSWPSWPKGKK